MNLRAVMNALLYMVRVGCQWRNLPANFPKWRAVNYYFECWKKDGTPVRMNDQLNKMDRIQCDRFATPSLMCVDSQSIKLSPLIYEDRGIDNNKKVNGGKRQLLVDTGGRIWRVLVHAANRHDGPGGSPLLDDISTFDIRLEKYLGTMHISVSLQKKRRRRG